MNRLFIYNRKSNSIDRVQDTDTFEGLDQYNIFYIKGWRCAEKKIPYDDAIKPYIASSIDSVKGFREGYMNCIMQNDTESVEDSMSSLIKRYRDNKTLENFNAVLLKKHIQDSLGDENYVLTKGNNEYHLGVKVPKTELDKADDLLKNDDSLEIKGEDDQGNVILGKKDEEVSEVVDSFPVRKNLFFSNYCRMLGYYNTKHGIFDSLANKVADYGEIPEKELKLSLFDCQNSLEFELNSLLAEEFRAWYDYYIYSKVLTGKSGDELRKLAVEVGEDELEDHSEKLLGRLKDLSLNVYLSTPSSWEEYSKSKHSEVPKDSVHWIEYQVARECEAIEHYKTVIQLSEVINDVVTADLLTNILKDEQEHLSRLKILQADILS